MTETLHSEAGVCTARWDDELGAIVVEWHDDVGGDDYRDVLERLLEWLIDREATKLVVDAREQGLMSDADQEWTVSDWQPRALEAGLEYAAVVYPEDRTAKSTVDMFGRKRPFSEIERVFTEDLQEAREWIGTK